MKKISTLFKKDLNNLGRVIDEINPDNEWVLNNGRATRKFDGTASAIINGELYKRYDVKKGRQAPENAIPCQEPDAITGHHPHWVKCDRNDSSDKHHFEAFDKLEEKIDGTYELVGPKIQGNPEKFTENCLILHGSSNIILSEISFQKIKEYLADEDIEGIVFHEINGDRMCKIRKKDFGIKR